LQIQEETGLIHYAGVQGHDSGLYVGQAIEFWLSPTNIANQTMLQRVEHDDGSVTFETSTRYYLTLTKYRVLRKQKDSDFGPTNEETHSDI
jgi:hypothetical protein